MKIKKYLPLIIFVLGLLAMVVLFFGMLRGRKEGKPVGEDVIAEIPFEKRPFVSLVPSEDGHWLKMTIDMIKIDAETLDYELLYQTDAGITQGVPGTVKIEVGMKIERDLLLGSESSGKFRYDEGVEEGNLTLRFRDSRGRLVGKLSTQFRLLSDIDKVEYGQFKFTTDGDYQGFIVVMETFGLPKEFQRPIASGPFGVFASDSSLVGNVEIEGNAYFWDGTDWVSVNKTSSAGVYIGSSE